MNPSKISNQQQWIECADPLAMLQHLETSGRYLELEPFFLDCFQRIRHEFKSETIANAVFDQFGDVEELLDDARTEIDSMLERLSQLNETSSEWQQLNREIAYSKAVLVREFHDFGEANRALSQHLIEIADDPTIELDLQIRFIRANYQFDPGATMP